MATRKKASKHSGPRQSAAKRAPAPGAAPAGAPTLPPMGVREQAIADLLADFAAIASDLLALHRSGEVAPEDQTACYRDGTAAVTMVLLLDEAYVGLLQSAFPSLDELRELRRYSAAAAARTIAARQLPAPRRLQAAWSATGVALDRCEAMLEARN